MLVSAALAAEPAAQTTPKVDFGYAFGYPHRLTVALPDSSDKTLIDCQPGEVALSWSYEKLLDFPPGNFFGPTTQWKMALNPFVDGAPLTQSTWTRTDGWRPAVTSAFTGSAVDVVLDIVGGQRATIVRVTLTNRDTAAHTAGVLCGVADKWRGVSPAGIDPTDTNAARDALVAGWKARADRVLLASVGGEEHPLADNKLSPTVKLAPGQSKVLWLIRPYNVYETMLPELRRRDWAQEFADANEVWTKLIGRTTRLAVADDGVRNSYYAGLADIFIMREPLPGDYLGTLPGTELYRCANPIESAVACIALDQAGLPVEAADGYRWSLDMQKFDGSWSPTTDWTRNNWMSGGFKSWFVMEHYQITRDREFLADVFPRLLANSRWQEHARQRMRVLTQGTKPLNYGLLPPGMGDAGLKNDASMFGVFLPQNIWAVFADLEATRAAETLGLKAEATELRQIHETGKADLLATIQRGAIEENGYRWIPGVASKTSGSRWGALNASFPTGLLAPTDELITGTIKKMQSKLSPGGIPMHTGWMEQGMWVAITLDNLGEALLQRGEGDAVANYFYATLNHGTPLYTWCEERGPTPGAKEVTGDRQHLWTPVAVVRLLRDMLVFEDGETLHLARGADRSWLARGELGGKGFRSHFGSVDYRLNYAAGQNQVTGEVAFAEARRPATLQIHVRLPDGRKLASIDNASAKILADGETIEWTKPREKVQFVAKLK